MEVRWPLHHSCLCIVYFPVVNEPLQYTWLFVGQIRLLRVIRTNVIKLPIALPPRRRHINSLPITFSDRSKSKQLPPVDMEVLVMNGCLVCESDTSYQHLPVALGRSCKSDIPSLLEDRWSFHDFPRGRATSRPRKLGPGCLMPESSRTVGNMSMTVVNE